MASQWLSKREGKRTVVRERDHCVSRRSNRETTVDEEFASCEVGMAKFLYFRRVRGQRLRPLMRKKSPQYLQQCCCRGLVQGEQWGVLMFMNDLPLLPTSAVASVNFKQNRNVRQFISQTWICFSSCDNQLAKWPLIYDNWWGEHLTNHILQLLHWLKSHWALGWRQQGF